MRRLKKRICLCAALLAGGFWMFFYPQLLFRDCVRAVFPKALEGSAADACLDEEDLADIFKLDESSYKVTLKFFQKD